MTSTNAKETGPSRAGAPTSRQVAWWPTHEFINALVSRMNHLPIAGTPAWAALSDDDPVKLLSLAAAGEHHVLRMETAQEASAEAAKAVAASASWRAIASAIHQGRGTAYIPRVAS